MAYNPMDIFTVLFSLSMNLIKKNSNNEQFDQLSIVFSNNLTRLTKIEKKLDSIQQGPLYSAQNHLEIALKEYRTPKERIESVKLALNCLIKALGYIEAGIANGTSTRYHKALLELYISFCWHSLESRSDVFDGLIKSLNTLKQEKISLSEELNKKINLFRLTEEKLENKRQGLKNNQINSRGIATIYLTGMLTICGLYTKPSEVKDLERSVRQIQNQIKHLNNELIIVDNAMNVI